MAGESATLGLNFIADGQIIPGLEAEPDVIEMDHETPGHEAESGTEATVQEMSELQIDPEFKDLIPPLCQEEFEALKENLSTYGCHDRLTIWKGQNILLDGHHRYQICTELGIPFETKEIELPSRAEAKIWILMNQRGRRNLNESQRAMLAVTLNDIYCEQAKERMGTRTDLGQKLAKCEVGRSAEKAAKDMGVSHQTVSFAKKVSVKGIPNLVKRVESGDIAVSAASKIASLPLEKQEKIMEKVETQIEAGSKPKVAAIMREIVPSDQETPKDADELLETFRKKQEANLVLLQGIETSQRPENLVEMLAVAERITAKLKEIETKSLGPDQIPADSCIIKADLFKTFLMSLVPASNDLRLEFEAGGVHAVATDMIGYLAAEAFLPKESFEKYFDLGKIGLPNTKRLIQMISSISSDRLPGKKNLRLYIESNDGGDYSGIDEDPDWRIMHSQDCLGVLRGLSGRGNFRYRLLKPELIMDREMPDISLPCELQVDGKKLMIALEHAKALDQIGKFLLSGGSFDIVSLNNEVRGTQHVDCIVQKGEFADPHFDLNRLMRIRRTIEKSMEVTLGLGIGMPMTMELKVGETAFRYYIKETQPVALR